MRKEYTEFLTVGDLRRYIADLPDEMPICRLTKGYYQVNLIGGVGGFVRELLVDPEGKKQVVLRLTG